MTTISYCVSCKNKTGNKNIKNETINNRTIQKSKCNICNKNKTTFVAKKKQKK